MLSGKRLLLPRPEESRCRPSSVDVCRFRPDSPLVHWPPVVCTASAGRGLDEFDVLRDRWAALNTGGAFDPTEPVYADALSKLTAQAQGKLSTI